MIVLSSVDHRHRHCFGLAAGGGGVMPVRGHLVIAALLVVLVLPVRTLRILFGLFFAIFWVPGRFPRVCFGARIPPLAGDGVFLLAWWSVGALWALLPRVGGPDRARN